MVASRSAHVEAHNDKIIDDTLDLLAFETQNPPGQTREAIDFLEDRSTGLGIETERIVMDPAQPNLIASIPGTRDETLLLDGHVGTVPYDRGSCDYAPLSARDGDRIYGHGVTDMKGALASMLGDLRAYDETDHRPQLP